MQRFRMTYLLIALMITGAALAGCQDEPASEKKPTNGAAPTETPTEPAPADRTPPEMSGGLPAAADPDYVADGTRKAMARGVEYLRQSQLPDGGWPMAAGAEQSHLGITAVVAYSLLTIGVPADDPMVKEAVDYILRYVKEDGGIYDEGLRNYTTSIGVVALKLAGPEKHKEVIGKALAFLKQLQWDEGEGLQPESADFGGAGYGSHSRPDLSNTAWFVEAMNKLGVGKDDPAMEKAVIFVSRTQAGEAAKGYWVSDGKGGFVYTPHDGGESKAGEFALPSGGKGLKAYGSMTYAGFLSLIYAGLERTDERVQAAHEWMERNWTLEDNPEMGHQGYYYYLMTVGKALAAWGSPSINDDQGQLHPWRKELSAKLIALQQENGSWSNDKEDRWYEQNPALATPYALVGLHASLGKL